MAYGIQLGSRVLDAGRTLELHSSGTVALGSYLILPAKTFTVPCGGKTFNYSFGNHYRYGALLSVSDANTDLVFVKSNFGVVVEIVNSSTIAIVSDTPGSVSYMVFSKPTNQQTGFGLMVYDGSANAVLNMSKNNLVVRKVMPLVGYADFMQRVYPHGLDYQPYVLAQKHRPIADLTFCVPGFFVGVAYWTEMQTVYGDGTNLVYQVRRVIHPISGVQPTISILSGGDISVALTDGA